jgi:hypothetical protein
MGSKCCQKAAPDSYSPSFSPVVSRNAWFPCQDSQPHALPDYALLYYYRHYQLRPSRYPYLQQIAVLRHWNFGLCENPEFLVYALAQIRFCFLRGLKEIFSNEALDFISCREMNLFPVYSNYYYYNYYLVRLELCLSVTSTIVSLMGVGTSLVCAVQSLSKRFLLVGSYWKL